MTRAFVGIGSNLDDPAAQVHRAIQALGAIAGSSCVAASRRYRNPPMGPADQPDYVNAVAALDTTLPPHDLLAALQALEAEAGRERNGRRWGPRPLDLDLLLYGESRIDTADLTVPHPGLTVRPFVLVPLAEIEPDRWVPGAGRVADLAAKVDDSGLMAEED